jgi:hypothetical protein
MPDAFFYGPHVFSSQRGKAEAPHKAGLLFNA